MFFGCPVRGEKNGLDSMKVETCFNLITYISIANPRGKVNRAAKFKKM